MKLLEKSDKEILETAQPIWDNLVRLGHHDEARELRPDREIK